MPEVDQYYLHLFAKEQPDLNWDNPTMRQEVYDILRFWLDKGIDGFRMDVITLISKDPAYPDRPVIQNKAYGSYYTGCVTGPHVHEYLQEMYREVLSKYDIMTVGETPHTSANEAMVYTNFWTRTTKRYILISGKMKMRHYWSSVTSQKNTSIIRWEILWKYLREHCSSPIMMMHCSSMRMQSN